MAMPVNAMHADYGAALTKWMRARDVLAGEATIKAGEEKYLPRLVSQNDEEYDGYLARASFFNCTGRTLNGYVGVIFRKSPFIRIPDGTGGIGGIMSGFVNDTDLVGTSLYGYSKRVMQEIIGVGRCGTLIDWDETEDRGFLTLYRAESIINWRMGRANGRHVCTLVVLAETYEMGGDAFSANLGEQYRVLRLVDGGGGTSFYQVEVWRRKETKGTKSSGPGDEWVMVEQRTPTRKGIPVPAIPFIFHGPEHSRPEIGGLPLGDLIEMNLSHYRLDADYKHGLHYTALPTAYVSGFEKGGDFKIGSSVAWVTETPGATAGFLEFKGQGLGALEAALDRAERNMAVLGSKLLEVQKRASESAEALMIRQSGEESILSSIAASASESLTQVMRWIFWWNSSEEYPEDVDDKSALIDLNTDFRAGGMTAAELTATVAAWQSGAISQETMFEVFRRTGMLPEGRTNEEEAELILAGRSKINNGGAAA